MKIKSGRAEGEKVKADARFTLGRNSYGKSRVRMLKVSRAGRVHTVREIEVAISLQGDFEAVHMRGDNAMCLPTDTMKNTVYALGKDHPLETIEEFALFLGRHFVKRNPQVERAIVSIRETRWKRLRLRGKEHSHCFVKGSEERQTCEASVDRKGARVDGAVEGLVILKSTDSAFTGYPKDEFTTLPETDDRVFATSVTARWSFEDVGGAREKRLKFGACRERVREALIGTFATHMSRSVQHTLHAMGTAALKACREITSIDLSMPNKHYLLANLRPFGMENRNEIFVPTDEPFGLIEATIGRS